ncbi:jerky protein homolog-like [Eupeodes corollae]|uniref:jerky protein homolog-like n=1 Tax=Eupeodes corollae TaxID=290404 RepID=UPI002492981D|nr:jerky protein homolog-like [Eupeodes corollae]
MTLIEEGYSQREIATRLKTSKGVVHRTIQRYSSTGGFKDKPRSGRPRVTTKTEDLHIITISKRSRKKTASEIRAEINEIRDNLYQRYNEGSAPGRKIAKDRFTFLVCTNSTGEHKLKLLTIGKAKNPRCFKNFRPPMTYTNSKTAWMTKEIFKNWFYSEFVPQVREFMKNNNLSEKALLILDNVPSHPPENELQSDNGCIRTMFMPPNATPLIQPMMDQNGEMLKKFNLRDALTCLQGAWDKLTPEVIEKCWHELFAYEAVSSDEDEGVPLAVLQQRMQLEEINQVSTTALSMLQEVFPDVPCSSNGIREWNEDVVQLPSDEEELSSEDSVVEVIEAIKPAEAISAINTSLKFAEQCEADVSTLLSLRNLREKAITRLLSSGRQSTIEQFFKKKV